MNKLAKVFTAMGLLLLTAAFALVGYNLWDNERAGESVNTILGWLSPIVSKQQPELSVFPALPTGDSPEEYYVPDYILYPEMEKPAENINGQTYIGVLSIPAFPLELPVISQWSYPNLKIAPCRYSGSAYLNNMVIAAHNYATHFGGLKNLSHGDSVIFTDIDGNAFHYQVVEIEIVQPVAIEQMTTGDWDLTLFTCTVGGKTRLAVRCERADQPKPAE